MCPISLLEALRCRLPNMIHDLDLDSAITCAWSLSALRIFPVLPSLLDCICVEGGRYLTPMQSNQLHQICLSYMLDPEAANLRAAIPDALWAVAYVPGRALGDVPTVDGVAVKELCGT